MHLAITHTPTTAACMLPWQVGRYLFPPLIFTCLLPTAQQASKEPACGKAFEILPAAVVLGQHIQTSSHARRCGEPWRSRLQLVLHVQHRPQFHTPSTKYSTCTLPGPCTAEHPRSFGAPSGAESCKDLISNIGCRFNRQGAHTQGATSALFSVGH